VYRGPPEVYRGPCMKITCSNQGIISTPKHVTILTHRMVNSFVWSKSL